MADYPVGAIARIEVQEAHHDFVHTAEPDTVVVSIIHARRIAKRGHTAESYFPDGTDVIVTTTVSDEELAKMTWEEELKIISTVEPDYHVPTDYPVYGDDPDRERYANVKECMEGTLYMYERFEERGLDTEILPLVKGYSEQERGLCYRVAEIIDAPSLAYYATQYFTGGGIQIRELETDLERVNRESDLPVIVLGLLSPNYLERMSENVVAGAGLNQWRKRVQPRSTDDETVHDVYKEFEQEILDAVEESGGAQ